MRKLDILIPTYNETQDVVKPLLDSIAIQQHINFKEDLGVIICCDGGKFKLPNEWHKAYPFEIEFYKCPHKGVSATRNACLDRSSAEYVMFCDADDMFCNALGLWFVFKVMKEGFDSLVSAFVEETRVFETKEIEYFDHEYDNVFVHGKVHKRQYLLDKNIRWNENLTIHEDCYFNTLCQTLSEDVKYCMTPFYLWRWRDDSVCRHDPKYMLRTYNNFLDSQMALIKEAKKRDVKRLVESFTLSAIFDAYYTMNKPEWINQENQEFRNNTEKKFSKFFKTFEEDWNDSSNDEKMKMSNSVRSRCVLEGMQMEILTIDQWLKHIKELTE